MAVAAGIGAIAGCALILLSGYGNPDGREVDLSDSAAWYCIVTVALGALWGIRGLAPGFAALVLAQVILVGATALFSHPLMLVVVFFLFKNWFIALIAGLAACALRAIVLQRITVSGE